MEQEKQIPEQLFYKDETMSIVFDDSLITAEMYAVAETAYHYYIDLSKAVKDDVNVYDRVRSSEIEWLFVCFAALIRKVLPDGTITKYDTLSHSEMTALLKKLPYTYVQQMRRIVEFFFGLQTNCLNKPIMLLSKQNSVGIVERIVAARIAAMLPNDLQTSTPA